MLGTRELGRMSAGEWRWAMRLSVRSWKDQLVQMHHSREQGENSCWCHPSGNRSLGFYLCPPSFPPRQTRRFWLTTKQIHVVTWYTWPDLRGGRKPFPSVLETHHPTELCLHPTGFMLLLQLKEAQGFTIAFFQITTAPADAQCSTHQRPLFTGRRGGFDSGLQAILGPQGSACSVPTRCE